MPTNKKISRRKPSRASCSKLFDITIIEVLVHRATIEATDLVAANELARDMWDDDGTEAFSTESLGRSDLIVCDEATTEVGA